MFCHHGEFIKNLLISSDGDVIKFFIAYVGKKRIGKTHHSGFGNRMW
jgi:hypothetical protein